MNTILKGILEAHLYSGENSFEVVNPATQGIICTLEWNGEGYIQQCIIDSQKAQKLFKNTSSTHKSNILAKWHDKILENINSLAEIIVLESGKPFIEAKAEVVSGAGLIKWYAEKAKRIDSRIFDVDIQDAEGRVDYQPIGVLAAITPWNFPFAMIVRKVAPAIAAGCSVILKPSELTPLSAFAARRLMIDAGADDNLFQVLCGDPQVVGKVFQENDLVRKISFTGSTQVGKILMSQAANTIKKISLELGGNAAFIVFENAALEKAVKSLLASKFRNAGQVCIAPNRVFVQNSIKEKFIAELTPLVKGLKQGMGFDKGVDIGPLINRSMVEKVKCHIKDALEKGAELICGGKINLELGGNFFEPTILDKMQDNMLASFEETFGPVVAIYGFDSEMEVLQRSNNTKYGLASYFFSSDINQIKRVRNSLECGMIGINASLIVNEKAPFGGIKQSGIGREGSDDGIYEFLEAKYSFQQY